MTQHHSHSEACISAALALMRRHRLLLTGPNLFANKTGVIGGKGNADGSGSLGESNDKCDSFGMCEYGLAKIHGKPACVVGMELTMPRAVLREKSM